MKKISLSIAGKYLGFAFVFAATALFFGFNIVRWLGDTSPLNNISASTAADCVIVIDPGHGGEDGGASVDGVMLEKDVNLAISSDLAAIMRIAGFDVRMTREDDRMLYDLYSDSGYESHKKAYDLKNRLRFTKDAGASMLISIHCNKFPEAKYKGMQVFYSPHTAESAEIAETLKLYNQQYRETDNKRETKRGTSAIYLLDHAEMPAVLIECGFLSNPDDAAKLTSSDEQAKIAVVIFSAISAYLMDQKS